MRSELRCAAVWFGAALALLVACGDDPPAPAPPADAGAEEADAAADAASAEDAGAEDADGEDADADAPGPPWAAWPAPSGEAVEGALEVSGAGTRLVIQRAPFGLTLEGADGASRAASAQAPGARHAPVAVGHATRWSPSTYYEPTLTVERRGAPDVRWYGATEVLAAGRLEGGGLEVIVATADDDGAPGPEVRLWAGTSAEGVTLEIERPAVDALVYTSLNLRASEGEGYYGFGELFDRVDSRGLIRELLTQAREDSETGTNEVHVPVGAYASTAGYGLYAEDRYPSAMDMGATEASVARTTSLSPRLRVHLAAVAGLPEWVGRYASLAGRPARVPIWALGPHFWRNENRDGAEALDDIARARAAGVPVSVIWIDRPWSSYYHNWRFDASRFPDPEGLFEAIHGEGLRVMLHHSPQLNTPGGSDLGEAEDASEGLYAEFLAAGWLVSQENGAPLVLPWGGGPGAHIDYSHPDAAARVQALLRRVTALGAVGTKMDWDEYLQPNLLNFRLFVFFHNGETNLTMKSWYSALYHKTIIEGFEAGLGEPGFHISRTGTPGDQVWNTCIWPGDLDNDLSVHGVKASGELNVGGLPAAIIAHQTLGLSGYPCFGSDVGGYRGGTPEEEVLLRWLWVGVLSAVTQLGGGGGSHMPWTADTAYSAEALRITREALRLRMQLVPYVHQGLEEAHRTGAPLVRPLVYAWPEAPEASSAEAELSYLFGPDLLVAPVVEAGATERSLWLPPGVWWDWWSGERLEGPGQVVRPGGLDTIPLLVREGAAIPLGSPEVETMFAAPGRLSYGAVRERQLLLAPGPTVREAAFVDGVRVRASRSASGVEVELGLEAPDADQDPRYVQTPTRVRLTVLGVEAAPSEVTLRRGEEAASPLPSGPCEVGACWSFDAAKGQVHVTLDSAGVVLIP